MREFVKRGWVKAVLAVGGAIGLLVATAVATTITIPYTFTSGTVIQSAQMNSNFSIVASAINGNLDSTNMNAARGIGANYIVSSGNGATGAFQGGAYTFTAGTVGSVPLTLQGIASQTADLFDVLNVAAGTKEVWVDSAGVLHTNGAPAFGGVPTWTGALAIAQGGTGATSFTSGDCVRASSATTLASAAGDCVTSVTASGNLASSGGTTPAITMSATPSFTSVTSTNGMTSGSSTYGPTSATVNGNINLTDHSGQAILINSGQAHPTKVGVDSGCIEAGVIGTLFAIGFQGVAYYACMDTSGNEGIAGQYYAGSSLALKRDVRPLSFDPLAVISGTKWVAFCYKSDPTCQPTADSEDVGFIAEDTSAVLAGSHHKRMSLNKVVGVEGAAIKELAARVARLEQERGPCRPSWYDRIFRVKVCE